MTQTPEQRLYELSTTTPWFAERRNIEIIGLVEQLAEIGNPRTMSFVASLFLGDSAKDVQIAVARALHQTFSSLRPDELLQLSDRTGWNCIWHWSTPVEWSKLKPSRLDSIALDESTRASVLGLASFHHNGYVRHEAIRLLAQIHDGSELPFLLIRQNDWVTPISSDARSAVQERLTEACLPGFVKNLPLVIHLLAFQRHDLSDEVRRVIELLIHPAQQALLANVLRTSDRKVRREIVRGALKLAGDHVGRVVELGLSSYDAVVRLWCAEHVRSSASGEPLRAILKRLKADPFMPVRREAMLIEAEVFPESAADTWTAALLDVSSSLRNLAQFYIARLEGHRPVEFYRKVLSETPSSLEALCGVGETGDHSDLPKIRGYLKAALPSHRRAAVRGLARIGEEMVAKELTDHIRDDSPSVVREVRNQLERWPHCLDGKQLFSIVNKSRQIHVLRAGLLLLIEMGKWEGLSWLILAAGRDDRETAQFAQALIERWFSPPLCNKNFTKPSNIQVQAISEAMARSKARMDGPFRAKLKQWLDEV